MATTEEKEPNRNCVGYVEEHDRARENSVEGARGAEVWEVRDKSPSRIKVSASLQMSPKSITRTVVR